MFDLVVNTPLRFSTKNNNLMHQWGKIHEVSVYCLLWNYFWEKWTHKWEELSSNIFFLRYLIVCINFSSYMLIIHKRSKVSVSSPFSLKVFVMKMHLKKLQVQSFYSFSWVFWISFFLEKCEMHYLHYSLNKAYFILYSFLYSSNCAFVGM